MSDAETLIIQHVDEALLAEADGGITLVESDEFLTSHAEQGPRGVSGLSAYEIAVAGGFVGSISQWLDSLRVSGFTFVHDQDFPSGVWEINHTLHKFPSVTCMDSAGDEIEGVVKYDSMDRVVVSFNAPTGGKAYLN